MEQTKTPFTFTTYTLIVRPCTLEARSAPCSLGSTNEFHRKGRILGIVALDTYCYITNSELSQEENFCHLPARQTLQTVSGKSIFLEVLAEDHK